MQEVEIGAALLQLRTVVQVLKNVYSKEDVRLFADFAYLGDSGEGRIGNAQAKVSKALQDHAGDIGNEYEAGVTNP